MADIRIEERDTVDCLVVAWSRGLIRPEMPERGDGGR